MPILNCKVCDKEFYVKPSHLLRGDGKYCSNKCAGISRLRGRFVKCFMCKKDAWKRPKALLHSKSGKFFCGKSCQTVWRNTVRFIGPEHPNWKGGEFTCRLIMARSNTPCICKRCGEEDKRVLAVHHIDKNRLNNSLKNLVWLCHNCHFLVHHDKEEKDKFMEVLV